MSARQALQSYATCGKHPRFGLVFWADKKARCPACILEELQQGLGEQLNALERLGHRVLKTEASSP